MNSDRTDLQNIISGRLPSELTDRTVDYLHDDVASLKCCSLVCRAWLPCSRFHLFRRLAVRLYDHGSCRELLDVLIALPHYATGVESIKLDANDEDPATSAFPSRYASDIVVYHLKEFNEVLTGNRSLTLCNIREKTFPLNLVTDHICNAFSSATSLELVDCRFHLITSLYEALCSHPSVAHLTLDNVSARRYFTTRRPVSIKVRHLRHLSIRRMTETAEYWTLIWLTQWEDAETRNNVDDWMTKSLLTGLQSAHLSSCLLMQHHAELAAFLRLTGPSLATAEFLATDCERWEIDTGDEARFFQPQLLFRHNLGFRSLKLELAFAPSQNRSLFNVFYGHISGEWLAGALSSIHPAEFRHITVKLFDICLTTWPLSEWQSIDLVLASDLPHLLSVASHVVSVKEKPSNGDPATQIAACLPRSQQRGILTVHVSEV